MVPIVAKVIALFTLGALLVLAAIGLSSVTREMPFELDTAEISHVEGYAYRAPMKHRLAWPWQPVSDHQYSPRRSRLVLLENAALLGRAHTPYEQVSAVGGGDYVHWGKALFFSTSDHTDPRGNGRRYHGTLTAAVAPRLLTQVAQVGMGLMIAALGIMTWLRKGQLARAATHGFDHLCTRLPDYALAVAIPGLGALTIALSLSPMWNGSDSVIWLLWQWHWIPHHPPIYPAFMALASTLFDEASSILRFAIGVQDAATVLAIGYLASAFRRRWQILVVSVAASVGVGFGLYAQGLYTEGLATAFFMVFLGAILRLHRDGPGPPVLAALALGLFMATLTRHAYLFFAIVPVAYVAIAGRFSPGVPLRASQRGALAMVVLIGGVALANNLVVRYACVMLDSQCISIVGRAGVYRMQDAYALVPEPQREAWLRTLVERAPDRLVAAAIPLMVTTPNPWTGPRDAIGLDIRFAGQSEDRLMNAGFESFLLWPDRFVLLQWWRQLQLAVLGPGTPDYCRGYPSCVFEDSARSVETVFPADSRSVAAVSGTGADDPAMGAVYRALEQHVVTRVADWLLPLVPARRVLFLTFSLLLGLAAMLRVRDSGFTVLLLALWSGAVVYALALTLVTVVLPRYVLPIDNVLWVVNGIALIALIAQRDPLRSESG